MLCPGEGNAPLPAIHKIHDDFYNPNGSHLGINDSQNRFFSFQLLPGSQDHGNRCLFSIFFNQDLTFYVFHSQTLHIRKKDKFYVVRARMICLTLNAKECVNL